MIWVWRDGAHGPHGPLRTEAEARTYAEKQAQLWPGEAIWLLVPSANVMVASARADLGRVRPTQQGAATRARLRRAAPATSTSKQPGQRARSTGLLRPVVQQEGKTVKRRTRLRKLGLPADPGPQLETPSRPSLYETALALDAVIRRTTFWNPARYINDLDVLEDCRTYGVEQTVQLLSKTGMTPSQMIRAQASAGVAALRAGWAE